VAAYFVQSCYACGSCTVQIEILKGLAKFHSASVALYEKNPNSVDDCVETIYTEKNFDAIMKCIPPSFNALANVVEKWSGF